MKRWLALLFALTMLFTLPGCSMIERELGNLLPFDIPDDYWDIDLSPDWDVDSDWTPSDDRDETRTPEHEDATEPLPTEIEEVPAEPELTYEEHYAILLDDFSSSTYYSLYDIDGDNLPELCVYEQNETECSIYGIKNNVVYCFGTIPLGSGGFVCGVYWDRGLLVCSRPDGSTYRELTYVTLQGSRLYSELLYSGHGERFDHLTPLSIYSAREEDGLQWQENPWNDHQKTLDRCRGNLLLSVADLIPRQFQGRLQN